MKWNFGGWFKEARQVRTGYALAAFGVVAVVAIVALVLAPRLEITKFGSWQALILIGMLLLTLLLLVILGPKKARPAANDSPSVLKLHEWTTKWYFGPKVYVEHLDLRVLENDQVKGSRTTTCGDEMTIYDVAGCRYGVTFWLEYHLKDGHGGGSMILDEYTNDRLLGLVVSKDCSNGALKCRRNLWLPPHQAHEHKKEFFKELAMVLPADVD